MAIENQWLQLISNEMSKAESAASSNQKATIISENAAYAAMAESGWQSHESSSAMSMCDWLADYVKCYFNQLKINGGCVCVVYLYIILQCGSQ